MVTGSKPATYQGPMRPVESITLAEMTNYIACLKKKTGRKFRFPDKTEWEYACRAGSTSLCYDGTSNCVRKAAFAGSGSSVDLGRYASNCDDGKGNFAEHTNVGLYVPNAYGLYDMLGNVGEFAECIIRSTPTNTYKNTSYTKYDDLFDYVGYGRGDYAKGSYYDSYSSTTSYAAWYYRGIGEDYVYAKISHFLAFNGGNYLSAMEKVTAKYKSKSDHSYVAPSYANLSFYNMDSQPYNFIEANIYKLPGDSKGGFRLFCDAE
jgi:hypothetical protein